MSKKNGMLLVITVVLLISLLLLFFATFETNAQQATWSAQLGTAFNEGVSELVKDSQDNTYMIGSTEGTLGSASLGGEDIFVLKYDPSDQLIWTNQYGSAGNDFGYSCAVDTSNNVYIVGFTDGNLFNLNSGKRDAFIAKLSPDGTLLWGRQFGSDEDDLGTGIVIDQAGNICVAGTTYGLLFGTTSWEDTADFFVVKYNSSGNLIWGKQFGNEGTDEAEDICDGPSNTLYITGKTVDFFDVNSPWGDGFLAKLDSDGTIIWGEAVFYRRNSG